VIILTELISITHIHQTKAIVFVGDQNRKVINLLKLNIERKIVIAY